MSSPAPYIYKVSFVSYTSNWAFEVGWDGEQEHLVDGARSYWKKSQDLGKRLVSLSNRKISEDGSTDQKYHHE